MCKKVERMYSDFMMHKNSSCISADSLDFLLGQYFDMLSKNGFSEKHKRYANLLLSVLEDEHNRQKYILLESEALLYDRYEYEELKDLSDAELLAGFLQDLVD